MITLSPLRWGKPYESLDFTDVVHFDTGEPIARVGNVGGGSWDAICVKLTRPERLCFSFRLPI